MQISELIPLNKLDVRSGISVYSPNGQVRYQLAVDNSNGVDLTSKNAAVFNTYQVNAETFKVRTTGKTHLQQDFSSTEMAILVSQQIFYNSLQGAWNKILVISAGTSNGSMIRFIESSSASGGADSGMLDWTKGIIHISLTQMVIIYLERIMVVQDSHQK